MMSSVRTQSLGFIRQGLGTQSIESVPLEHVFIFDNESKGIYPNKRDISVKNRYHFYHPPEWYTSNTGEKIIGFRSLWISQMKRNIKFDISFSLPDGQKWPDDTTGIKTAHIFSWNDIDNTFLKLYNDMITDIKRDLGDWAEGLVLIDWSYFHKVLPEDLNPGSFSSNGKFWRYYNDGKLKPDLDVNSFCIHFRTTQNTPAGMTFMISNLNDDAKAVFHAEDFVPDDSFYMPSHNINCIDFYDVWDRHSCMIKSNLANGVQHNYLGYSKVRYDPIKYYKINDNNNSFSIELYNGHYNNIPSLLPFDDKDAISIEYVILQNTDELYT